MKVLFTSEWYPDNQHPTKGIFIKKHKEALNKQEIELTVLIIRIRHGNSFFSRKIISTGENEFDLIIESRFWKLIYVFYPLQRLLLKSVLRSFFENRHFDIIHSNVTHPNGVLANFISKEYRIPYVITEHHSKLSSLANRWPYKHGIRKALDEAATILPVSTFLKEQIVPLTSNSSIRVVPNVVDSSDFRYLDSYLETSNMLSFCSVGTWDNSKGNTKRPDLIVEALNLLARKYSDKQIVLRHIGNCSLRTELISKVSEENFSIQFLGVQTPQLINSVMNESTRVLHATDFETFCVVVVEAQKAGVPFVASNVPPIESIVNPYGASFTSNTVIDWLEAIERSISCNYDRSRISEEAIGKYNSEEVGSDIVDVYTRVLNKSNKEFV